MNKSQKQSTNYEAMALFYNNFFDPVIKNLRKQVINIANVKEKDSILEIGSGTGEQALLFARKGAIVTGVDISKAMLRIAKKKTNKNLKFIYGDSTDLKFKNNTFDISTTSFVLHEMNPLFRDQTLKEMISVTKNKGRFIIVDYTIPKSKTFISLIYRLLINTVEKLAGEKHYRNYRDFLSKGGLYSLINKYGFKIEEKKLLYGNNVGILKLKI